MLEGKEFQILSVAIWNAWEPNESLCRGSESTGTSLVDEHENLRYCIRSARLVWHTLGALMLLVTKSSLFNYSSWILQRQLLKLILGAFTFHASTSHPSWVKGLQPSDCAQSSSWTQPISRHVRTYVKFHTKLSAALERRVLWQQVRAPVWEELLGPQRPQCIITSVPQAVVFAARHQTVVDVQRHLTMAQRTTYIKWRVMINHKKQHMTC